jgi:hypothetical protein
VYAKTGEDPGCGDEGASTIGGDRILSKQTRQRGVVAEDGFQEQIEGFCEFGRTTSVLEFPDPGSADRTPEIPESSVRLVVTLPPFLDVVDYQTDNWLRCWFNGIDAAQVRIWQLRRLEEWREMRCAALTELRRVLVPGGFVAFEVGEVRGGKALLENLIVPAAARAGLRPLMVLVNDQVFTKTSNCWGVDNLRKGTKTNRIVLLGKDG